MARRHVPAGKRIATGSEHRSGARARHLRRVPRVLGVPRTLGLVGTFVAVVLGLSAGVATAGMTGVIEPSQLGPVGPVLAALPGVSDTDEHAVADAGSGAGAVASSSPSVPTPTASTDPLPPTEPSPTAPDPTPETPAALVPTPEPTVTPEAPATAEPTPAPELPAPPVPPAAAAPADIATTRDAVLQLTNAERESAGCGPVHLDDRITTAAQLHSEDMATNDYFSHEGLDGSDFVDRLARQGYDHPRSENIAMGYATAADVVAGWMASPGHRANILDCSATAMGLGLADAYWTQAFGTD